MTGAVNSILLNRFMRFYRVNRILIFYLNLCGLRILMNKPDQKRLWLMFKCVMPIPIKRILMIFIQNAYVTFQNQFVEKKRSICAN